MQSEFYAFGFEAYKSQPDIGFDICAHNNALVKFCGNERKTYNVQVKARLVNSSETSFYISAADIELLKKDSTCVLVCVLAFPVLAKSWNSFEYINYRESSIIIDNQIFESATRYALSQDKRLTANMIGDKYNISAYQKKYFWLHANHIKRMINDGFFADVNIHENPFKKLTVNIDESNLLLHCPKENYNFTLAEEMQSIKYLVNSVFESRKDLDEARMFIEDAF